MLPPEDTIRLRHMLEAAERAIRFCAGRERTDMGTESPLGFAIVRLLEIMGEAASQVSDETRTRHPSIPWQLMTATRNRLMHGYFDVDYDIVWQIVTRDLPAVTAKLKQIVD